MIQSQTNRLEESRSKSPFSQFLGNLKRGLLYLLHGQNNPHKAWTNTNHLESPYRRQLTSPDAALGILGNMLTEDEHFLSIIQQGGPETLIRAAVIGDELRANFYRLERFPLGQLFKPYNEGWRKSDVVHIRACLRSSETEEKDYFVFQGIDRPYHTDLSYDLFDPFASYMRVLNEEELHILAPVAKTRFKIPQ